MITGGVGSGKTTLLRVLLGLLPMDEGAVYWDGHLVAVPVELLHTAALRLHRPGAAPLQQLAA